MRKYLLAFFAISLLASMENSIAMGYMQPQGGYYGQQPFPMAPGSCSKSYLLNKHQKNLIEYQQEMAACQQGNPQYCEKAQKDYQDAQKYLMQYQNCPYP